MEAQAYFLHHPFRMGKEEGYRGAGFFVPTTEIQVSYIMKYEAETTPS